MKRNITISVDSIAYLNAKNYIDNISAYLNECLVNLSNNREVEDDLNITKSQIDDISKNIQDLIIKKSIMEMDLKKSEEIKLIKIKEEKDRAKFKRWICPICNLENILDNERCSKCLLPLRNDPKTKFIYINEFKEV